MRGEKEAARIAALQDARDDPARLGRNRLHRQRAAETPFAAHRDAEQGAQHEKDDEVRGERRQRPDDRIGEDVEHQRGLAPPSVADAAEDEGADEAHRQRQEQCVGYRRHLDAELLGDVLDHEGEDEEVERVERPAEIGGEDGPLLLARQVHPRRSLDFGGASGGRRVSLTLDPPGPGRQPKPILNFNDNVY